MDPVYTLIINGYKHTGYVTNTFNVI